jgi:hypothetical protein
MKLVSIAAATVAVLASACSITEPALVSGTSKPAGGLLPAMVGCGVTGQPQIIARQARVQSGVEVASFESRLAVGYAVDSTHGVAVDLDPSSLRPTSRSEQLSHLPIRHIAPVVSSGALGCAADAPCTSHTVKAARTVLAASPFVVGTVDDRLAWADGPTDEPHALWSVGTAPIELLRGVSLGLDRGYAVTFRQNGKIFLGALTSDKVVRGPLTSVDAPNVTGELALAASDGVVMVAWGDRFGSAARMGVQWTRWVPGQIPTAPHTFEKELEGEILSPSLSSISGGGFLLAYTQRTVFDSRVNAQAIDSIGAPIGAPLTISGGKSGAGWANGAVTTDGRGVVAFLAPSDAGFEVMATPIACRTTADTAVAAR